MYDVIIVGARCAGAAAAMLLARRGYRVLVVDRASFPSDIPHGHFVHRLGPRRLHQWGLLDCVTASCPPVTTMTVDFGDFPLRGDQLEVGGVPMGLGPRRMHLDAVLLQAAADAGAEVRQNFSVTEAVKDANETVTGIRGRTAAGTPVHEAARLTVGADGRRSAFASWVGASIIEQEPPITFWYFSYWSGMPNRGLELIFRGDATIFTFPTGGDLTAVFVAWKREAFDRVRANVDAAVHDVADRAEEFGERLRRGRREERLYGAIDLPNFIRRAQGPGWALVGDAACHKDPMLALGICDAFRDAELLAQAADDGLSGRDTLEAALGRFDRQRIAATMPDYHENIASARMEAPADLLALRARLRDDPAAARQFYLAREGMIATPPVSGAVSG